MAALKINIGTPTTPVWFTVGTMGSYLCLSSTRPPSPFTGLNIFETDTGCGYVWSGISWRLTHWDPARVRYDRALAQTILTNSETVIDFTTKTWSGVVDPGGTGANGFTLLRDAWWSITASVLWVGNATGRRYLVIERIRAGVPLHIARVDATPAVGTPWGQNVTYNGPLLEGDVITASVFQNSGGNLDLSTFDYFPLLSGVESALE